MSERERDEARVETLRETMRRAAEADRKLQNSKAPDEREKAARERETMIRAGLALTVGEEKPD